MTFALYKCFILISFCSLLSFSKKYSFFEIPYLGTRSFVKVLNSMTPFLVMLEKGLSVGFHKDKNISWKVAYLHDELNYLWISAGTVTWQMYAVAKSSFLGPVFCFSTTPNLRVRLGVLATVFPAP